MDVQDTNVRNFDLLEARAVQNIKYGAKILRDTQN